MSILKIEKRTTPYVQIDKTVADDLAISFKAKGLMLYLLSRPDSWKIYISQLAKVSTDGRESVTSAINELIERGYILRTRLTKSDGTFDGYDYRVFESPRVVDSVVGETVIRKPDNGKPVTTNKDCIDNDGSKIESILSAPVGSACETEEQKPPSLQPSTQSGGSKSPCSAIPPLTKAERDILLHALVRVDGADPAQVPKNAWSNYAGILSQIRSVYPLLSESDIKLAAENFKKKYPNATVTANTLGKRWGELSPIRNKSVQQSLRVLEEPIGWSDFLDKNCARNEYAGAKWSDVSPLSKKLIYDIMSNAGCLHFKQEGVECHV